MGVHTSVALGSGVIHVKCGSELMQSHGGTFSRFTTYGKVVFLEQRKTANEAVVF